MYVYKIMVEQSWENILLLKYGQACNNAVGILKKIKLRLDK